MSDKKLDLLAEIAKVLRTGEFAPVLVKKQSPEHEVVGELDDQEKACFTVLGRLTSEIEAVCAAACGGEHQESCPEETRLRSLAGKKSVVEEIMWQLIRDRLNLWDDKNDLLALMADWKVARLPSQRGESVLFISGLGGGF